MSERTARTVSAAHFGIEVPTLSDLSLGANGSALSVPCPLLSTLLLLLLLHKHLLLLLKMLLVVHHVPANHVRQRHHPGRHHPGRHALWNARWRHPWRYAVRKHARRRRKRRHAIHVHPRRKRRDSLRERRRPSLAPLHLRQKLLELHWMRKSRRHSWLHAIASHPAHSVQCRC
jgi:hypothetical protein